MGLVFPWHHAGSSDRMEPCLTALADEFFTAEPTREAPSDAFLNYVRKQLLINQLYISEYGFYLEDSISNK